MAEIQACPSPGLSPEHFNYLKCWVILNHQGRAVFEQIFLWGFIKPLIEIKTALFELPNYSNKMYRSDFNASQREKIEQGDLSLFDLGLFYLLLQKICSLPPTNDIQWGKDGDSTTLPNMLYKIKMKRNVLAHNNIEINEKEMFQEISEMRALYLAAFDAAAVIYNIEDSKLISTKDKIYREIDDILNSSQRVIIESVREVVLNENELDLNESEIKLAKTFKPIFKTLGKCHNVDEKLKELDKLKNPIVIETRTIIKKGEPILIHGEKALKEVGSIAKDIENVAKEAKPVINEAVKSLKKIFKF